MGEPFRFRRFKVQGFLFTPIYLAVTVGGAAAILLLDEPQKHGFNRAHSVAIVVAMWVAVFGGMTLISALILALYYRGRFSVDGNSVGLRSVFRTWQFDAREIERLIWIATPSGGRITFMVPSGKVRLHLHGILKVDRLQIIQLLHGLIPKSRQVGWPLFCMKIALPLREGAAAKIRVQPAAETHHAPADVQITRRRYDRLLAVILPLTMLGAFGGWWVVGWPQLFVIPVCVVAGWAFLRFSTPREGTVQKKLMATSHGRTALLGYSAVVGAMLLELAALLAGCTRDQACSAALVILGPALPIIIYRLYREDKQRKDAETSLAASAVEQWDHGEFIREDPTESRRRLGLVVDSEVQPID